MVFTELWRRQTLINCYTNYKLRKVAIVLKGEFHSYESRRTCLVWGVGVLRGYGHWTEIWKVSKGLLGQLEECKCFRFGKYQVQRPLPQAGVGVGRKWREMIGRQGPDYLESWGIWSLSWEQWLPELFSIKVTSDLLVSWICSIFPVSFFPRCQGPWDWGFPDGSAAKESACQCRRLKRCRLDPWVRMLPGTGCGNPQLKQLTHTHTHCIQYSCLENSMDRGGWQVAVRGVTELDTAEHTHASPETLASISLYFPGPSRASGLYPIPLVPLNVRQDTADSVMYLFYWV